MEALRESEERFRAVVESTNDPVYMKDLQGRYLLANPAALHVFGAPLKDILGKDDMDIISDVELAKSLMETDRRIMTSGESETLEETLRTSDGLRTFLSTKTPYFGDGKKIIGIIGISRDITERKRTEEALSASEAKYRSIFENVQEMVAVHEIVYVDGKISDWKFIDANQKGLRSLGKSSLDEIAGKGMVELFGRESIEMFIPPLEKMLRTGQPLAFEYKFGPWDRYYISAFAPLGDDLFLFTSLDITEIKKAQIMVENEQRRLRTILDTLPVGVWVADRNGAIIEVNDLVARIWGGHLPDRCTPEEFYLYKIACAHSMILYEPEEGVLIRALFRGETTIGRVFNIPRPDGSHSTVLSSTAPIRNAEGIIIGAVGVLEDITRQKELEQEALEERDRAELYIDLLTHDITNYNTAAMGYLQLAEVRLALDEKENALITKPLQVLRDSSELIANVRDLQRVEAGREKMELIDICQMLKDIKDVYESPPGREVTIALHGANDCSVMASALLRDAFSNIVSNSIKHSSGPLSITISMRNVNQDGTDFAMVSFEDNGPGIPDERKEKVFDRSITGLTKPVSQTLGLYLVKQLVRDYGGKVWVEDRIAGDHAQGARFVLMLPLARVM